MRDQTRGELRRHPAVDLRRGAGAALLCAALVGAACGSNTSRDERSAGTEHATGTAAPAAPVAPTPDIAAPGPSPDTATPDTQAPAAAGALPATPKAAVGAVIPAKAAEADRGSKPPTASAPAAQRS